ncbi:MULTISPECIES: hypothetical protein [Gammaproteobacteria]|jgi:hypothetical protein|uniref:hypothetical protein n=1 Tax=Gammaproteobacteria TaxID=1236 RepID=UPI0012EAC0E9|nr:MULTISPECIES: hypothetical protein [Gammaproteobacteria]MCD1596753.1 hypothetical protein [Rheinheimera aquimaris]MEC8568782.1 hypothetical protein [Pseudomonadota bacterium]
MFTHVLALSAGAAIGATLRWWLGLVLNKVWPEAGCGRFEFTTILSGHRHTKPLPCGWSSMDILSVLLKTTSSVTESKTKPVLPMVSSFTVLYSPVEGYSYHE